MHAVSSLSPVAAIDLGSNTVRLLAAAPVSARPERLLYRQETTRLGRSLEPGRPLQPEAAAATRKVLRKYCALARSAGAERILVGATMAVRESSNGREFLEQTACELGVEAVVLSGRGEAELSAAGVLAGLDSVPPNAVIFDLGGRSTEFILSSGGRAEAVFSLEIGAVSLTEAYLGQDPPKPEEIGGLRAAVDVMIARGLPPRALDLVKQSDAALIGTAGTVTTLAAMMLELNEYRPELINNFLMNREALGELFGRLIKLTLEERSETPGLSADREDIIIAGAVVVLAVMDYFQTDRLIVSDAGLLEGLWLAAAGLKELTEGEIL